MQKTDNKYSIKIKRVPTGISNFDSEISGGFPEGFNILLAGGPGTGKSIFGLEYIYKGAKKFKENGIYFSLEQSNESLKKQALMFGWDFESAEIKDKIEIIFLNPNDTFDTLLGTIKNHVKRLSPKRLVIDSFTTLFSVGIAVSEAYDKEIDKNKTTQMIVKKNVLDFFNKIKSFNCTTIIVSEIPVGTKKLSEDGMSEFACDGIILLKRTTIGNEEIRTISVEKMRLTKIKTETIIFEITDEGIMILKNQKKEI